MTSFISISQQAIAKASLCLPSSHSFLRDTPIPSDSRCSDVRFQKIVSRSFSAINLAVMITTTTMALLASPPFWVVVALVALALIVIGFTVILNLWLSREVIDYEDSKTVFNIIHDLRTLSFTQIMAKYDLYELNENKIIDPLTFQKMKEIDDLHLEVLSKNDLLSTYGFRYKKPEAALEPFIAKCNAAFEKYRKQFH